MSVIKQILRFGIVGVIAFVIDYGLMVSFVEIIHMNYIVACSISFTISTIVNYLLSMSIVFISNKKFNKYIEFLVFLILSLLGLVINGVLMVIFVDLLGIYYLLSKILVTGIVMIYNYMSRKIILERR